MPFLPPIPEPWTDLLDNESEKDYFLELNIFLDTEEDSGKMIYPAKENVFKIFKILSPEKVKVVILGQDPYHGEEQAQGLSFSVPDGMKLPPSLRNIYKELEVGLEIKKESGDLSHWAKQGVFLLNAVLTVEKSKPGSHQNKGWEIFTDKVIEQVSQKNKNVVFVLWGKYAQSKSNLIDSTKHYILQSPHPSPFSAHRGFFGSKPFSKVNEYLRENGQEKIEW